MPQFQNSSLSQNGNGDIEHNSEMKIYLERLISPQIYKKKYSTSVQVERFIFKIKSKRENTGKKAFAVY